MTSQVQFPFRFSFIVVVLSFYQELMAKTIKGIFSGQRGEEYINNDEPA